MSLEHAELKLSLPIRSAPHSGARKEGFGFITSGNGTLTARDLSAIGAKSTFKPCIITISDGSVKEAERLARGLGCSVLLPHSELDFMRIIETCRFTVSEGIIGMALSFLFDTPCYFDAGNSRCRKLYAEICEQISAYRFLLPYTKNRAHLISGFNTLPCEFAYAKVRLGEAIAEDLRKIGLTYLKF